MTKEILQKAQSIIESLKADTKSPQEKLDAVSEALVEVWKNKRQIESAQVAVLSPVKKQEKEIREKFGPDYSNLMVYEYILKDQVQKILDEAKAKQAEAYQEAVEAGQRGDKEAVHAAMIKVNSLHLNTKPNVFFRNQNTYEIVDLAKVPREFYKLDKQALQEKLDALPEDQTIPGVKRTTKVVVVVRE